MVPWTVLSQQFWTKCRLMKTLKRVSQNFNPNVVQFRLESFRQVICYAFMNRGKAKWYLILILYIHSCIYFLKILLLTVVRHDRTSATSLFLRICYTSNVTAVCESVKISICGIIIFRRIVLDLTPLHPSLPRFLPPSVCVVSVFLSFFLSLHLFQERDSITVIQVWMLMMFLLLSD